MAFAVDVSVIIPTYNAQGVIREQLSALAEQRTSYTWEVLVADNGSTDQTVAIVREFADRLPGLRVVDAARARGPAVARNQGAAAASGRALLFCDADDVAAPDWLERLGGAVLAGNHVLAGGQLESALLNTESTMRHRVRLQDCELPIGFDGAPYVVSANLGVGAPLFQKLRGFDESFRWAGAEDVDFSMRAATLGVRPLFVRDAVIHYRYRVGVGPVLRQAHTYGRGQALLSEKHPPSAPLPTLGDDLVFGWRWVKQLMKLSVVDPRAVLGHGYTAAYRSGMTRQLAAHRHYWTLRSNTPRFSFLELSRQRLHSLRRTARWARPPDGDVTSQDPWRLIDSLWQWPRQAKHLLGVGLLADADVLIYAERGGRGWFLRPALDGIVSDLIEKGEYAREEIDAVVAWLAQADGRRTIVNVGANIGTTAVEFALRGYRVLAIEPVPAALDLLHRNIEANGVSQLVTVCECAISKVPGSVAMVVGHNLSVSEVWSGNRPIREVATPGDFGVSLVEVEGRGLDDVVDQQRVGDVALVWSDTEGSEAAVISTGASLWRAGVPLWVEIRPDALLDHTSLDDFRKVVSDHFESVLTFEDIQAGTGGRSVDCLPELLDEIGTGRYDFANVLLLPRYGRAPGQE